MRSYFVFLSRNKLYTAINFLGLTVSLAFIILIASYTSKQLQTDSFQENADRIYFVGSQRGFNSCYWLQRNLVNRYPEIEKATALEADIMEVAAGETGLSTQECCLMADSSFFDMFTLPVLDGEISTFKLSNQYCVISQQYARRNFGDRNPIGEKVNVIYNSQNFSFFVGAIMKNLDNSVLPDAAIVLPAEPLMLTDPSNGPQLDNVNACYTVIMTYKGADISTRSEEMLEYFKEILWNYSRGSSRAVRFTPLKGAYFNEHFTNHRRDHFNGSNRDFITILITVGIILLIFALLNYVNLTVAQSSMRAREMAMRRLLGTSKAGIMWRLIKESLILCLSASVIALLLAYSLLPTAAELLDYRFTLLNNFNIIPVSIAIGSILLIGTTAGLIPAMLISQYHPIEIVKGVFRSKSKNIYGKLMIGIQYVITIAMLIATAIVGLQVKHLINAPLGYDTDDCIVIKMHERHRYTVLKEKLLSHPQIVAVGFGEGHPFTGLSNTPLHCNGKHVPMMWVRGDSDYFRILGLRVKQHNSSDTLGYNRIYFNEYALKETGYPENATEIVDEKGHTETVSGIYYDFRFHDILTRPRGARIIKFSNRNLDKWCPETIVIKTQGDHTSARQYVSQVFSELYPELSKLDSHSAPYVDELLVEHYNTERRLLKIIGIFTALALLISTLGLLAMSTYYIRQRRQDIAVKRVFGASQRNIVGRLAGTFLIIVGIAFLVAMPIIYMIMRHWLEGYSYHIDQPAWLYAATAVFAALVAFCTIAGLAFKAARENPVAVLKKD